MPMASPSQAQQQAQAAAIQKQAQAQILSAQQKAEAAAVALWASYKIHNDDSLADFLKSWLPVLLGTQRAVGLLTQSYLNSAIQSMEGIENFQPLSIPVDVFSGAAVRNGVDPSEVYKRPFIQFWSDLADKKPIPDALASAQARLQAMAAADLQLAHTHAARATLMGLPTGSKVTGYRRVLGGSDPCELCVLAASQRYHIENLMPIHNRCHCTVWPIVGTKDLGQRVNVVTLADNPPSADTTEFFGQKVLVRQHGEMGPLLTAAGHDFMNEQSANRRVRSLN